MNTQPTFAPNVTMRDYFAAAALQGILPPARGQQERRGNEGVQAKANDYADIAYIIADAMLRAREASQ